ncbi:MAG TPA: ribosome silencing factor, partial [Opitutaceae bacterium]
THSPDAALPPVLKLLCQVLDDKKAEDLRVLRVSEQSSITDFLVIATGTSDPHLRALRIEVEKVLDANAVHIVGMDTTQESGWVVIDAFDIMIHLLNSANRERYALENLWKDAVEIPMSNIVAPPPVVAEAKPKAKSRAKAPLKSKAKAASKNTKATKPAAKKPAAKTGSGSKTRKKGRD